MHRKKVLELRHHQMKDRVAEARAMTSSTAPSRPIIIVQEPNGKIISCSNDGTDDFCSIAGKPRTAKSSDSDFAKPALFDATSEQVSLGSFLDLIDDCDCQFDLDERTNASKTASRTVDAKRFVHESKTDFSRVKTAAEKMQESKSSSESSSSSSAATTNETATSSDQDVLIGRRKSFSLPNGLESVEIRSLRDQYATTGSTSAAANASSRPAPISASGKIASTSVTSSSITRFKNEDSFENRKSSTENMCTSPLLVSPKYERKHGRATTRKKGVVAQPPISISAYEKSTIHDILDSNSNNNSITSLSSLANLLKEKIQYVPVAIKKHNNGKFKIKLAVGFLFVVIVFLIAIAHILYYQQIVQRAYFEKIKFNKLKRVIKFYNENNAEIIRGYLGRSLTFSDIGYNCLEKDRRPDDSVCLEWTNKARLYLNYRHLENDIRCYTLYWKALSENFYPTDCYDWSRAKSFWYGGGQNAASAWPLEKATFEFEPFISGDAKKNAWGNAIGRYFINSKGIAIKISEDSPLYVSLNANQNKMICLEGRYDNFAYANNPTKFSMLNYTICSGQNLSVLHNHFAAKTLWDGLKEKDIETINSLIAEPVWELNPARKDLLTETLVSNFTESVIASGFLKQGHVLLAENWQKTIGDFRIDQHRLETLHETITVIHRRGFKIVFTIQPFVSTESDNFANCVQKQILIYERDNDIRIPALTQYKTLATAAVIDITNNRTFPWLMRQLKQLLSKYKIDSFLIDFGTAYTIPKHFRTESRLANPDEYKRRFLQLASDGNINIFAVSGAVGEIRPPIFVMMPAAESSWTGLRSIIPTILSYGIIGYPFFISGPIGGDVYTNAAGNETDSLILPDKELYKRWFQVAIFLPVLKFRFLPHQFHDPDLTRMVKSLILLRQKTILHILNKYVRESLDSGMPIIKPLWMLEPNEVACYTVSDEFLIGDELLVAPVLTKGARTREVYLPTAVWKDGIDGSLRKGNRWIHNYKVNENQIAYFIRMPDNTRF